MSVAAKLGNGSLELGVNLGIELPAIKALEVNHPRDVQRVLLELLVMWNNGLEETSESAVIEMLCSVVSNMHRNDVVLFIQKGELFYDISYLIVLVLFDSMVIRVIDGIPRCPLRNLYTIEPASPYVHLHSGDWR